MFKIPKWARYDQPLWLLFSGALLTMSVLYTSYKTAFIQFNNADALIQQYLFRNWQTFHHSLFAAAHTQLLKWPIFWLLSAVHHDHVALIIATVALPTITYGGFVWLLLRVAPRNYWPLILLALSLVISLTPAQLQGVYLPINLAMVTTRNIEYLVYFAALYWLTVGRLSNRRLIGGALMLGLLDASDKYFLLISVFAGLGIATFAWLRSKGQALHNWRKTPSLGLLSASIVGAALGTALLAVINKSGLTKVAAPAKVSPFTTVSSVSEVWHNFVGAIKDIFINFGVGFWDKPSAATIVLYVINSILLIACVVAAYKLFRRLPKLKDREIFATSLVLSSMGALLAFCFSTHQVNVDARYLYIFMFAGFYCLAWWLRSSQMPAKFLHLSSGVLLVAAIVALPISQHRLERTVNEDNLQTQTVSQKINQQLAAHHIDTLVGNYWDVLPVANEAGNKPLNVALVVNCNQQPGNLTATNWRTQHNNKPSALYLNYDIDGLYTGSCSRDEPAKLFGQPTSRTIIYDGNCLPAGELWFYNSDIRHNIVSQ